MRIIDCHRETSDYQEVESFSVNIDALRHSMEWSINIGFNWQEIFLSQSEIRLRHPKTGTESALHRSIVTSWNALFIDGGIGSDFAVVVSHLGIGFRINGIYLPEDDLYVNWGDHQYGAQRSDFDAYRRICSVRALSNLQPENSKHFGVLVGEENFAHFLHNEVSGLFRVKSNTDAFSKIDSLYIVKEPFGPLTSIFPSLDSLPKFYVSRSEIEQISIEKNLILLGDVRLSASQRRHIIEYVNKTEGYRHPELVSSWKKDKSTLLMVGLRSHSRVVDGIEDAYLELIRLMIEKFQHVSLIVDGFSLPADFNKNQSYPEFMNTAVQNSRSKSLDFAIRAHNLGARRVICTADYDIITAVWLSMQADYYFTNLGTQQHKAGWFSNSRGIIHGHPYFLTDGQMKWFDYLVEGSHPAIKIPDEFYEILDQNEDRTRETYRIMNSTLAAEWAFGKLTQPS